MAQEPIWNQVHSALVSALGLINPTTNPTGFWNTVKAVYDHEPSEWDRSQLPAIAVFPAPTPAARDYAGGSRTVAETMVFMILAVLRDDSADKISVHKRAYRLVADIHRAIYVDPKLGLSRVRRILVPVGPLVVSSNIEERLPTVEVRYQLQVEVSFLDDAP